MDVQRQAHLKQLAAAADERWASKPSVLDAPRRRNQEIGVGDGEGVIGVVGRRGESANGEGDTGKQVLRKGVKGWGEGEKGRRREENPWKPAKPRGAGEGWQPEAWQPPPGGG